MLHDFRYPDAERYRNLAEPRIVRFLCSAFELAAGRAAAERAYCATLLQHLVDLGLPYRVDAGGGRRYDLAELINFIKYAHHALGDATWRGRSVATMRRLMQPQDTGLVPEAPPEPRRGGRYRLTLTRRFERSVLPATGTMRLHLPKPLNAAPGSHRVIWLATGDGPAPVDDGIRYSLRPTVPAAGELVVSVCHEFTAQGSDPAPPGEAHLRPREGLVHVSPAVARLAEELGLRAAAPLAAMRRIWDWLFETMSFGFIHYDRLDADDPMRWGLEWRRVDCRTGSALIVALCRAAGIPARMLTGYTLNPVLPTFHSWCEAWIEGGWVPFDTYAVDLAGGERDSPWRQIFFGRIDDRFIAECLPLSFCGLGTPRLPPSWQLCGGLTEAGATTWYEEVGSARPIYSESVRVD